MHDYRILIGAAGWQHAQWFGEFYPDGLPAEWRLGFYGNEFRVVLLPESTWPRVSADVQQFVQDSGDSLAFLCELPVERCRREFLAENRLLLQAFGARLLGIIVPQAGVSAWPELPGLLAEEFRVCIDAGPVALHDRSIPNQDDRFSFCWYGEGDGKQMRHGCLAVARIRSEGMTPRGLRHVLECLLAAQDAQRYLVLIVEGEPPSIDVMRQALLLQDLL